MSSVDHLCNILSSHDNRLLIVGGAGSLFVDPDHTILLKDTPDFPEAFMPFANAQGEALEHLKTRTDVQWTFLSPAADF
ncbi:hypothetical protein [Erysipelothrix larvae]|uniref:hypothetical protein n=1 Tax=Erysipelothrix larvae TaxID=1514105 RepID=UPI0018E0C0EF|nr:hypothetical protein [Erysipelothrix larvae]